MTKAAVTAPPEDKERSGDRDVPGATLVVQVEVDTAPGTVWGPAAVMSGDAWPFSVCELAEMLQISFRVFPPSPPPVLRCSSKAMRLWLRPLCGRQGDGPVPGDRPEKRDRRGFSQVVLLGGQDDREQPHGEGARPGFEGAVVRLPLWDV